MERIRWLWTKIKQGVFLLRMFPLRVSAVVAGGCLSIFLAIDLFTVLWSTTSLSDYFSYVLFMAFVGVLYAIFLFSPIAITVLNLLYLILPHPNGQVRSRSRATELVTISWGGICSLLLAWAEEDMVWLSNWWEQLYDSQLHAPIATWTYPTVITIGMIGLLGYLLLWFARKKPVPPLVTVLGLAGLYLGVGLCVVTLLQLAKHDFFHCLYLGNLILIFLKVLKELLQQWKKQSKDTAHSKKWLRWLYDVLSKPSSLPLFALLAALPLLGIALAVLTLFGQEPDSIIQAWTQTSDWTFSQQVSPPNLTTDMHYLCTVAAGGHPKLVKPLRTGQRHGHSVLVNRQLAVANAFEELLQQRTPRFHKWVRGAYDRYGYPIAKHIRSPWVADLIWLLMKPAEWFFLTVLYLFDLHPENRIAVQYPHKPVPTIHK